jgi:hypothetical protein
MKNFRKTIFINLIFILISGTAFSQSSFNWDKLIFGGNFGLGITSNESAVLLSPTVGYRFSDQLELGTGVIYQYYHLKIPTVNYQSDNYGTKIYTNYLLSETVLAHVEYEWLNLAVPSYDFVTGRYLGNKRANIGSLFVGGGFRQGFGRKSVMDIMLLYNLTEGPNTPYANPVIRVGFGLGI